MIRAILVDDEPKSIKTVQKLLAKHCPEVELLATAEDVPTAYELLLTHKPDLVFLDVEMPKQDGFSLLEKFDHPPFDVIFITGYDRYALKAIKYAALDYLIKPVMPAELQEALQRRQARIDQQQSSHEQVKQLLENLKSNEPRKLAIPDQKGISFVAVADLVHLEADGNYTRIYLCDAQRIVSTRTLKELEALLPEKQFFRVHHSHLINLSHVKRFEKEDGGYLLMQNGQQVEVSRRRKSELLERLSES